MTKEKIEKLKKKEKQLRAEWQKLEAGEKTRERKKEVRQKILLGALVLEKLKKGDPMAEALKVELDAFLKRDNDRAIFGFMPLLPEQKQKSQQGVKTAILETA